MEVEAALAVADALVFAKTGKHFSTLQAAIFRGAWSGQKYEEIAEACYCSETHVKMVGAALWELLSQGLAEKVSKKTFRAALERINHSTSGTVQPLLAQVKAAKLKEQDDPGLTNPLSVGGEQEKTVPSTEGTGNKPAPPSPVADLELPEGQVKLGSKFYIERPPIESRSCQTILKPGSLIRIKAPRQMGKSSLMARILHHAAQQGYPTVTLNFQLADNQIFQDLDLFLKWFCARVSRGLQLPNQTADYWDDIFGSKTSCKDYFENYLLAQLDEPLVLALEEVNYIFPHPFLADDFFALLRSWHEEAKDSEVWQKLRLLLVHSTEVYIPLNINQSPFNVGLSIELPEFTPSQVQDLAHRHGLYWNPTQVEQLMGMVGGHPYLVRLALYHLARHDMTLEELLHQAPTEAGPFSDHLRRHLWNLQQQSNLSEALKMALEASSPVQLESLEVFKLHSMGLVHLKGNEVTLRCELYQQYFRDRLEGVSR
ncbi:MAG: AAA-like domain-containing protein [Xenococcaceae cyanobacterium]